MSALEPAKVAKWSAAEWQRQVKMLRPSDGGATGVLFAFVKVATAWSVKDAAFVIKPVTGSAASTEFAEHVLGKVAKAKSLDSTGVSPTSPLGQAILATIDAQLAALQQQAQVAVEREVAMVGNASTPRELAQANRKVAANPTRALFKAKHVKADDRTPPPEWEANLRKLRSACASAGSLLVQRLALGMQELGDVYRESGGLVRVLNDATLMKNFGRLYVADAILGNGDRLDAMNTGNVAFGADGSIFAIDSGTVLASFDALLYDAQQGSGLASFSYGVDSQQDGSANAKGFSTALMKGQPVAAPSGRQVDKLMNAQATTSVGNAQLNPNLELIVLPPSVALDRLFDPLAVWEHFRKEMLHKLEEENRKRRQRQELTIPKPAPEEWERAKTHFVAGVIDGMKRVDTLLGGFSWLGIRQRFKKLVGKHGSDPNLDWTNFKLRRLVVKLVRQGKSVEEATTAATAYAQRKLGGQATW